MARRRDSRVRGSGWRDVKTGRFTSPGVGSVSDTLTPSLAMLAAALPARVNHIMAEMAKDMEAYAKDNAPWEDRTGRARAGLKATHDQSPVAPSITLSHTVEYGVWLEIRWSGKYAIIMPTIEWAGPELMNRLRGIL